MSQAAAAIFVLGKGDTPDYSDEWRNLVDEPTQTRLLEPEPERESANAFGTLTLPVVLTKVRCA